MSGNIFFSCATSDGLRPSLWQRRYRKHSFQYLFFQFFLSKKSFFFSHVFIFCQAKFFSSAHFFLNFFCEIFSDSVEKNRRGPKFFQIFVKIEKKCRRTRFFIDFHEIRKNPYEGLGLDIILTSETGQKWCQKSGID